MNMATGTQPRPKAQRKTRVVSVACQTDTPYHGNHGTGCTSTTPQPQAVSCDDEYEDATVLRVGGDATAIMTDISTGPDDDVVDEGKEEDTLRIAISRFSIMSETMCSKSKRIRGVPWRIMVMPKQHVVQKKQQKCMGFFLQCFPDKTYSDTRCSAWSCKADAEMRLVSQKQGISNFVRKTSHTYTAKENDWGYSCFMTWADVLDENQGYIKDDKVLMEIHVKAEPPRNMMSRDDFVKAIDQWYNLAEMQMSRNQVDLALEANAQGLKFCKDKDEEMKEKLHAQKEELVKKKVIDSISRIEKHGTTAKTTEPLKPTSLRQALTGAQRTIVSKNGCKGPNKRADRKAAMQQIKKKKQELAASKESAQKKKSDSEKEQSDSTRSYSPCSPRYSCSSEEEHPRFNVDDVAEHIDNLEHSVDVEDSDCELDRSKLSEGNLTSEEGEEEEEDEEEDEDVSDYYNEDNMVDEMCDEHDSLHGSSSSLEESTGNKVENGSQTEESGDVAFPQPIPRRERRPAGKNPTAATASRKEAESVPGDKAAQAKVVIRQQDRDRLTQYCQEHFGIDTMEQLFQELINELENNINQTMNNGEYNPEGVCQNFFTKLDTLSDDHGTCCLAAGLCTVHARRILDNLREFRRLMEVIFKEELQLQRAKRDAHQPVPSKDGGKTVPRQGGVPADFTLDLAHDSVPAGSGDKQTATAKRKVTGPPPVQPAAQQSRPIAVPTKCCDPTKPHPDNECEQSISKLLDEMGACKVYDLIAQKLAAMKENDANKGLITLLSQLYQYFQALSMNSDQVAKYVDFARYLHAVRSGGQTLAYRTKVVKENEKRLVESETLIKRLGAMHLTEAEGRKKAEEQLKEEQARLKQETEHAEQISTQLRDARAALKKTEKKVKQEETRNASLLAEKIDFEDRLKAQKKEFETLKKKSNEERNKAKREKDKDTESIRRLEAEQSEKDAEFQREKSLFEEKLKELRTKENKSEKERKQMQSTLTAMLERARASEVGQLNLMMEAALRLYQKTQAEIEAGLADAEENLKRARTQSDVETMKKSVTEWRTAGEELEKVIRLTKSDYESAADLVAKGTKPLAQIDIQARNSPALPKVVRLPPVQVVQPSTAVIAPPHIQTPPVGVIGQPRPGNSRCVESPQNVYPQQAGSSDPSTSSAVGTPSAMKVAPHDSQPQFHRAESSGWNSFSSPFNVSDIFRGAEPSRMHQQPPAMDMWNGGVSPAQMNRNMYPTHQHPIGNWANAPGWQPQQRPTPANPQQQYQRPY